MMKKEDNIVWSIIIIVILISFIAGVIYMTMCVGKFEIVQMLSKKRKWLNFLISLAIIGIVFVIIGYTMSFVNAITILLNEVMFFLLSGVGMRIVRHISGKTFTVNWQGWIAIVGSVIYLIIGYYFCHHVWQTDYTLRTEKKVGTLKIAMFADSHIGAIFDGNGFAEHIKTIEQQNPDIVLIAGDFVDDWSNKTDLQIACKALKNMKTKYGVWLSYGNHDEGFFNDRDFTAEELTKTIKESGIHLLIDEYELIDDRFYVVGRKDRSSGQRKDINSLLKNVDKDKYIIVLDHQPNDYDNEANSYADLVLSGHTHGGQLFPITYVGEWFHLNDRTYGYEQRNKTDFIVTSGIADWAIKFKTGTKSEYVVIDIVRATA